MPNIPSDVPATTLRQRLIEDMNLHRLSQATQRNYLRDVARFASWLGRPPDIATDEDLRRYQIEQSQTRQGAPAMNAAVSALRFFYTRTLNRPDLTRKLHRVKHPRVLPTVLSREEVAPDPDDAEIEEQVDTRPPCTCCGGHMVVIETFER